jgi:hypothetical protein
VAWKRTETHTVGGYTFHWFHDGEGAWLIAVWREENAPDDSSEVDLARALTLHHISRAENPAGDIKPVRQFCERFLADVPFRVRAIRNKVPCLRTLAGSGALHMRAEEGGR